MTEDINTFTGYLGSDFQLKLLHQLCTDIDFSEKTIPLIEVEYFDNPSYKRFFSILRQYYNDNKRPPNIYNNSLSLAMKKYRMKNSVEDGEMLVAVGFQIKNWDDGILNGKIHPDGDVVQKETINFIKQQEYRKVASYIQKNVKEGDNSDEFLYSIEEKVTKISEIGNEDDMGIEVMENYQRALEKEFRKTTPTGIDGIDYVTKGGLANGEIGIILAPSGVGKSTILTYIANHAYSAGRNVLQIIFEDGVDDIRRKHFTKWSKISLSEIDNRRQEVEERVLDWHEKHEHGKLVIKKFPQENTTIPKIKQFIENYRKKFGVVFDIVILDYIDVVESHKKSKDQNESEISIIKAFEGMADHFNIPCWTAIQTNRAGFNAQVVDTNQMGGSIKRAQKTHFLMSVAKTQDQKLEGQATIQILKARFAQDGHIFNDCIFDNNTMEIKITDDYIKLSKNSRDIDAEKIANERDAEELSKVSQIENQESDYEEENVGDLSKEERDNIDDKLNEMMRNSSE